MSTRSLSRYLLREGTTWRKLYITLRMNSAKELLKNSSDNLETIAYKIGFSSASSFSYSFSREIGESPQEYRLSLTRCDDPVY
jgi:transcriptional regulator GlxA family with amidase domain